MPDAIAHSVRARNRFVHGSAVNMSMEDMFVLAPFFTDTLEFVFGVSELCRGGWDAERWAKEGYSLSHYKSYISNFSEYMKRWTPRSITASPVDKGRQPLTPNHRADGNPAAGLDVAGS